MFNAFPAIKELGADRLQALCDSWRETGMAKECGVTELAVGTEGSELCLDFKCQISHGLKDGDEIWFPMDDLLLYIADHGVLNEDARQELKQRIFAARKRGGPEVYRHYSAKPGPKLPLFITCKNPGCKNTMITNLRHCKTEIFEYHPSPVECPRCHETYCYDHNDYHFGPNA